MQPYEQLENDWERWLNGEFHCVAVSSGTSALHLALECLNLPPGSKAIVPEFTMVACARAVTMAGHTPVFRDCYDDLLMKQKDPGGLPIMTVSIYGRYDDPSRYHLSNDVVIEDLAECHGVRPHTRSFAACWSFYKNKIVHGEEGGMIAFKDENAADQAKMLRSQGFTDAHDFQHIARGVNARMSNLNAVPIISSFAKMEENLKIREEVANEYECHIPLKWYMPPRTVNWVHDIRIPGLTFAVQDLIIKELNLRGIQARHGFKPMSCQREYVDGKVFTGLNAYRLSQEVIYFPVNVFMSDITVKQNCDQLLKVCASYGIVP